MAPKSSALQIWLKRRSCERISEDDVASYKVADLTYAAQNKGAQSAQVLKQLVEISFCCFDQLTNWSIYQLINRPILQFTDWPINQPIDQLTAYILCTNKSRWRVAHVTQQELSLVNKEPRNNTNDGMDKATNCCELNH